MKTKKKFQKTNTARHYISEAITYQFHLVEELHGQPQIIGRYCYIVASHYGKKKPDIAQ